MAVPLLLPTEQKGVHDLTLEVGDMNIIEGKNRRLKILDLYAGFGGASQAFLDSGDEVTRIENNKQILSRGYGQNTIFANVESYHYDLPKYKNLDLIISGLPCQEFSLAYNAYRSRVEREGRTHFPDLSHLQTTIEIIERLQPKHFIIENVAGAIKYFKPYLGDFTQKIGAQALWHNLPQPISIPAGSVVHKYDLDTNGSDPLRSNERAKWPYSLSAGLRDALLQKTLWDWGGEE